MYLGLGLRVGGARSEQIIGITTGAYLDVDSLIVGLVLQDSFVSGTYPDFKGNTVTETVTGWYVNGVLLTGPDATSYTLQSGDDIGQAQITLSASGANDRIYYSGIESIVDYSHVQGDIIYEVPIGGGSIPDAFVLANWSIADDGTNGDATVTITTLPADNGSAITDLEYRIGTGAAVSWGATSTGTYGISGLPDDTATNIQIRALNANGPGAWSDTKSITTTGAPDAFTSGQWTVTDLATGGDARIAISALPAANGAALTDLECKVGAGAWTSLAGTTTGNYDVAGFTDGVATNVLIRAVNAKGNGPDSDTKSVTTSGAAGGISLVGWATAFGDNDTNATLDLTALTGGSDTSPSTDDYVIVFGTASSGVDSDVTISDGTYGAIGTDIYQSDTFKINTNVFAKVQGGTPDTSVSINGSGNTTGGNSAVAVVLRGVDTTTPLDVAVQQGGSLNTALANALSITPSTAGAWIIAGGGISQDLMPGTFTGPANMTDYHQEEAVGSSRGNVTWAALKTDWSSGAFDPDALTGGDESTSYAFGAFTIAVRPA